MHWALRQGQTTCVEHVFYFNQFCSYGFFNTMPYCVTCSAVVYFDFSPKYCMFHPPSFFHLKVLTAPFLYIHVTTCTRSTVHKCILWVVYICSVRKYPLISRAVFWLRSLGLHPENRFPSSLVNSRFDTRRTEDAFRLIINFGWNSNISKIKISIRVLAPIYMSEPPDTKLLQVSNLSFEKNIVF